MLHYTECARFAIHTCVCGYLSSDIHTSWYHACLSTICMHGYMGTCLHTYKYWHWYTTIIGITIITLNDSSNSIIIIIIIIGIIISIIIIIST